MATVDAEERERDREQKKVARTAMEGAMGAAKWLEVAASYPLQHDRTVKNTNCDAWHFLLFSARELNNLKSWNAIGGL